MSKLASLAARAAPWLNLLYGAAIAVFAALLVYYHFQIITAPAPIELFEGTMVYFTELFARGENPYAFEMQPEAMFLYTPLYNILVAPLSRLFGNSIELHRIVNGVCILLSCGLLAISARRLGAKWVDCAAVAAIAYAALLYFATPIASGGGLGEALFLASILLPWLYRWSTPSLFVSALLGILAFYTKQYFLLSLGVVSVYLFLSVSKLRSVIYAAGSGAVLLASITAIQITSPYFLADTLFAMSNAAKLIVTIDRLTEQLLIFAQVYAGPLLLMLVLAFFGARRALKSGAWKSYVRPQILPLNTPLLSGAISYPWTAFALTTAAIVVSLGQNPGQYMSYLYQLMTPFLLLGLSEASQLRSAWRPIILPLYFLCFVTTYDALPKDFNVTPDAWRRISQLVCASETPYVSGILVLTPAQCDKPVFHGGHTSYFAFADLPGLLRPEDPARQPSQIWRAYLADMRESVRTQRFDVIVLAHARNAAPGDLDRELVRTHYRRVDRFLLSFSHRRGGGDYVVTVWRPLPPGGLANVELSQRARARQAARQQTPLEGR